MDNSNQVSDQFIKDYLKDLGEEKCKGIYEGIKNLFARSVKGNGNVVYDHTLYYGEFRKLLQVICDKLWWSSNIVGSKFVDAIAFKKKYMKGHTKVTGATIAKHYLKNCLSDSAFFIRTS